MLSSDVGGAPGIRGFKFVHEDGRQVWVLWYVSMTEPSHAVTFTVQPGAAWDMLGNPLDLSTGLVVGVDPVYMEWTHVLYFDGEEDQEGWVAASLVFTIRSDLPSAQVTGENGANLRSEPGGTLVAWLPYGTPVQIIETAEVDGVSWGHVLLPDERGGWIAQHLLNISVP